MNIGIHISHCCAIHGCKYGNTDCPVENKLVMQKYPCEYCEEQGINSIEDVIKVLEGKAEQCPNCGYLL